MAQETTTLVSNRAWRRWLAAGVVVSALAGAAIFWAATRNQTHKPDEPFSKEPAVPDGPAWFRDKTAASDVRFTFHNGEEANFYTLLETLGGGVAMIDYDGDGLLDLFFTGGGSFEGDKIKGKPCKLYKNLGGWKFSDVTAVLGLDKIDFYSQGCAVADYDRDGWPDLLVTGYHQVALFHNDAGLRFIDVTAKAGIRPGGWATSAAFADLTGSGYPDLYICHYSDWSMSNNPICKSRSPGVERDTCSPLRFKPARHVLYRNNGDGTFRDVSDEQGLREGYGLGVVIADFSGEGRPSIYVANDESFNQLYVNRKGRLEEKGIGAGVAGDEFGMYNGSMGVDVADYDGSGWASIFVTNFQSEIHALYHNAGKERFNFRSHPAGIGALSRHYVGFGTSFIDVDNDGWEDLIFVNGHVLRSPVGSTLKQEPVLLRNIAGRDGRVFQNWSKRGGPFFQTPNIGRGLAVGDLDNDGWPDLAISHTNHPVALLRNEAGADAAARWLGVKLVGKGNRDVSGSTVTLQTDGRKRTRFSKGGGSYLSASDRRILFGLGPAGEARRLTVKWAWGEEQHFDDVSPGSYWELREKEKAARRMK